VHILVRLTTPKRVWVGRVATVSVTSSNPDEGATGPSHLRTGDDCKTAGCTRVTTHSVETHGFIPIGGPKVHAKLVPNPFPPAGTGGANIRQRDELSTIRPLPH
jgi:hypothetical protein